MPGVIFSKQSDEIQCGRGWIALPHGKHFGKVHDNKYPTNDLMLGKALAAQDACE
jgi:hypothetical protein